MFFKKIKFLTCLKTKKTYINSHYLNKNTATDQVQKVLTNFQLQSMKKPLFFSKFLFPALSFLNAKESK